MTLQELADKLLSLDAVGSGWESSKNPVVVTRKDGKRAILRRECINRNTKDVVMVELHVVFQKPYSKDREFEGLVLYHSSTTPVLGVLSEGDVGYLDEFFRVRCINHSAFVLDNL